MLRIRGYLITTNGTSNDHAVKTVLDHGFVRVVDIMGCDQAIVEAARVSYGQGTRKVRHDRQLIRYLLRHGHTSPFEMCELKFHVSMPIFVARQWVRHRTASVNEISARYSILEDQFYIPTCEQLRSQSKENGQGRSQAPLPEKIARRYQKLIQEHSKHSYDLYRELLEDENTDGLSRELARIVLPTNVYTQWYWKTNLHNLLHFIHLRIDPHAQYEIRVYAQAIAAFIESAFPITWEAFEDYVQHRVSLSKQQAEVIAECLQEQQSVANISKPDSLSEREWRSLLTWMKT